MATYREVSDKVDLALIYFEDGAPRTAARLLRQAAAMAERNAMKADQLIQHFAARGEVEREVQ